MDCVFEWFDDLTSRRIHLVLNLTCRRDSVFLVEDEIELSGTDGISLEEFFAIIDPFVRYL